MTVVTPGLCSRKCSLTVSQTYVGETNTYALLLTGSGDGFGTRLPDEVFTYAGMQGDGGDICFSSDSSGSNQLPCEIVYLNNAGKNAEIWVSVPLSSSASTTLYVWYKTSGTTQPAASASYGSQNVWNGTGGVGSMVAVLHFGQTGTPASWLDSTSNANNAVNTGSSVAATGKILGSTAGQGGASFDGSTQYAKIAYASSLNTGSALTLQSWLKQSVGGNPEAAILKPAGESSWSSPYYNYGWFFNASQAVTWATGYAAYDNQGAFSISDGGWHHVTGTSANGGNKVFYGDGSQQNTESGVGTLAQSSTGIFLGCAYNNVAPTYKYNGLMDELRIHSIVRSAQYIATDYAIQSNASGLISVGIPQNAGSSIYGRRNRGWRAGDRAPAITNLNSI